MDTMKKDHGYVRLKLTKTPELVLNQQQSVSTLRLPTGGRVSQDFVGPIWICVWRDKWRVWCGNTDGHGKVEGEGLWRKTEADTRPDDAARYVREVLCEGEVLVGELIHVHLGGDHSRQRRSRHHGARVTQKTCVANLNGRTTGTVQVCHHLLPIGHRVLQHTQEEGHPLFFYIS